MADAATLRASPSARRLSVTVLVGLVLLGLGAPWLAPYDPNELVDPEVSRLRPPFTVLSAVELADGGWQLADRVERTAGGLVVERLGKRTELPAAAVRNLTATGVADRRVFVLGSDKFGRDVLSRTLYGARVSITVGVLSIALAATIGISLGTLAALGGRVTDMVLMRAVDGLLAFPTLFLLIALGAIFPGGEETLVLVIGATAWMGLSRLVRAELMSLKQRDFVLAARGLGATPWRIVWRHLLPNAATPIAVETTLRIGDAILAEVALSFLGFGVQPPRASWGNMIDLGRNTLTSAWWVAGVPALALVVTVVALNLAADALRDRLDPHHVR